MEKENNSAGRAKVLEPKKEKRRRLVLSSDSETEGFEVSARGKADEVTGGSRIVTEEEGGVGEKAAARQEFLERRLGTEGGKEKLWEMRLDGKSREAGDAHVIRKKIKSYSLGSDGYQSEKAGAVKVLQVGSDRKRSMAIGGADVRRKKAKSEHAGDQLEKTGGNDEKPESLKHKGNIMKGFTDGIQGLNVKATASKQKDMDSQVERKLHFNPNKCCKTETEHARWLEQLGERGHQKRMDNRVPGVGIKKEENDGSSQHGYIRMQGKNGVLKVLQKNKVHAPGNAIDRSQVEGYTRRLTSPNAEKRSKSNDEVERWGDENSRSTGKVSAEGRSKVHGAKSKPEKLSENSGVVHLPHGKTSDAAKKRERVSSLRSPPLVKSGTKESRASRNEVKKKLREQIKNILLDAGWKIELRPRKGRDYEDAVYVSPQGTGYWSITKAYDVYREQLNSDSDENKGPSIQCKPSVGADSNHEGPSSTFAAIDPEALSLLKRNVVNKRKRKEAVKLKHKVGGRRSKKSKETTKVKFYKEEEASGDVVGTRIIKKQSNNLLVDGSSKKKMHLIVRNKKGAGCVILVRGSKQGKESEKTDYVPYVWKRTVLSWMIDMGVLPAYGKVRYMNKSKNRTLLEGRITRDGIHCSCCSKILTVSKFEIHAGSKLHQPYENTLVEVSGISLLQCQINTWEKQEQHKRRGFYEIDIDGDDQNDDTCGICGDGGDLMCCDGCPSTFHLNCLGIQMLPPGDWHCANCSCKFCGVLHNSASSCKDAMIPLLTCSQCEQKYHEECVPDGDAVFTSPNSSRNQFCGQSCRKVFRQLQKLIAVKNDLEAGYSWSIIRRFGDPSQSPSRFAQRVECNSKIAVAHAVMDECFLPIIDHRSGINLIDNVVYNCWSNFNRLNFSGFYTFILERNDEIISVASVRIHGTRLAEMPFIGTRSMYRRQGMCRRLLEGIESALCSFSTEQLIIPAISELTDTWTTVFGFKPLEISQKEEIKCVNMWVFPGTGLLHKQLLKKDSTVQNTVPQEAGKQKSELIHHEVIGGRLPETQLPIEADHMGSAAEILCTKESAKHEEEGTEDTTKGSAVKVICSKELKPMDEGAEHKIPALGSPDFDLLPDASQVFSASMLIDNFAERDPIADPQTQFQLFDDDFNLSNPHIDTGAKFVTETVESHADGGEEAVAPVDNKVKFGHAADKLENNVNKANAEVSVGIENLNAFSVKGSKFSSVTKQNGFEACVSGIGDMAEIHDKQDPTVIQRFPAAEHCHCDDRCVLEISHDSNSLPCSLEQNACDPIDHKTQHQNSENPDKSSHADHESCNYCSTAVITNEKSQIDAVSCLVLEADDNLLYAMPNNLVPQGSFTVSGSVKSLPGGSVTGFVSIDSTTEISTNKIMISTEGGNQPAALATCEVGDDICTEINDNYHEGACDVRIAEEDLDVLESVQAFDLSSVNHTSKVIT